MNKFCLGVPLSRKRSAVNQEVMHEINRGLVLSSLRRSPSQTRAKLASHTGLTRSAITYITDKLIQNEMIREVGLEESTGGRRGVLLELNPDGASAIALKINASAVQCVLTNLLGEVLWHELVPLSTTRIEYVLDICEQLIELAFEKNRGIRVVVGIGIVVTGVIGAGGRVIYSKYMNWEDVDLRTGWEQKFGVKVSVDNEVNGATFGENHYGSAIQDSNFIYIEIGHGLGGGIVIDGQLYRGSRGFAGEVGFMTILCASDDGKVSAKSWQSLVNITNYMSIVRRRIFEGADSQLDIQSLTIERLIDALHYGDEIAMYGMREMCRYRGTGIANLGNIFDITVFIIGGELGKEFGAFLSHLHGEIDRHTVIKPPNGIDVRISKLMPDAALMGAVAQVFDDTLREPELIVGA